MLFEPQWIEIGMKICHYRSRQLLTEQVVSRANKRKAHEFGWQRGRVLPLTNNGACSSRVSAGKDNGEKGDE